MTRFADLITRLRAGADHHEREGDIGLPFIMRQAADALEHDAMPKLITFSAGHPDYAPPSHDEGWRIVRSIDAESPDAKLLWEKVS